MKYSRDDVLGILYLQKVLPLLNSEDLCDLYDQFLESDQNRPEQPTEVCINSYVWHLVWGNASGAI